MRKVREFWIYADRGGYRATTIMPRPVSRAIHVREVLDPDPKDEVIKIMREALEYYSIEVPYEEIVQVENWCTLDCPEDCKDETHWTKRIAKVRLVGHNMKTAREALAAVEKLEKK